MNRFTMIETVFILIAFGLIFAVLNQGGATGLAVHQLSIDTDQSQVLNDGESFLIEKAGNYYQVTALRVHQDYSLGIEAADLVLDVGLRRFRLNEGEFKTLDLDNDGREDVVLWLDSVSNGMAYLRIIS